MVLLKLSTLQHVVAAGDPSPPLFAHSKPPAPCIPGFSRRRPTKPLALSSTRNVRRWAGAAAPFAGEENGGEASAPERFLGSTKIADFMRFNWVPKECRGQLQTAVVGYTKRFQWSLLGPSLRVDLVSTIHIADKEYFTTLQEQLKQYDCVLYEMVASRESLESSSGPTAARRLKPLFSRGYSFVGWFQRLMAQFYALDFQLDCLDYQPQNWFHADLDLETFEQLQLEKGESFFTFALDKTFLSTEAMKQSPSTPDGLDTWRSKLLWASRVLPMPLLGFLIIQYLCDVEGRTDDDPVTNFETAMKVDFAKQVTSESLLGMTDVGDDSVIVGERNRVAMEVLKRAIDDGRHKIAILYGAGHMPDLGRRLQEEFDLIPTRVQWITAWSIRNRGKDESFPWQQLLILCVVVVADLSLWGIFIGIMVHWLSQIASEVDIYVDNTFTTIPW